MTSGSNFIQLLFNQVPAIFMGKELRWRQIAMILLFLRWREEKKGKASGHALSILGMEKFYGHLLDQQPLKVYLRTWKHLNPFSLSNFRLPLKLILFTTPFLSLSPFLHLLVFMFHLRRPKGEDEEKEENKMDMRTKLLVIFHSSDFFLILCPSRI